MNKTVVILIIALLALFSCKEKTEGTNLAAYSQQDTTIPVATDNNLFYHVLGGPPSIYEIEERERLGKIYGITFQNTGCEIDGTMIANVERNNRKLFEKLQKKYPGFTEQKMNEQLASYIKIHQQIDSIVFKTAIVKRMQKKLEQKNDFLHTAWQVQDVSKDVFLADLLIHNSKTNTDSLLHKLKIQPLTRDVLIKTSDGGWSECTK